MQVDPIKPTLKAPGTNRLKLKYEKLLSNIAFNFNLRRYPKVGNDVLIGAHAVVLVRPATWRPPRHRHVMFNPRDIACHVTGCYLDPEMRVQHVLGPRRWATS